MARGGYRPGAGRPPGSKTIKPADDAASISMPASDCPRLTPMAYLSGVMSDDAADPARRDRAAIALLPFEHARPGDLTLKQKREMAAQAAFTRRFQPGDPPAGVAQSWQELIEGPDPTRAQ